MSIMSLLPLSLLPSELHGRFPLELPWYHGSPVGSALDGPTLPNTRWNLFPLPGEIRSFPRYVPTR